MTDKEFNYIDWLAGLQVGDKVKLGACSRHNGCACKKLRVVGLVDGNVLVDDNCTVRHFSQANGREIGSRKDTYKSDTLGYYGPEDIAADELAKAKEDLHITKKKLADEVARLTEKSPQSMKNLKGYSMDRMPLSYLADMVSVLTIYLRNVETYELTDLEKKMVEESNKK